jgi:SOS-response transcriptional repressor LexA
MWWPLGFRVFCSKELAMAVKKLTAKQAAVLEYVISCIEKENRTPTIRQIGTKFKLRSTGSVRDVIAALVKKGELIKDAALSRGVRLNPNKYKVKVMKKK